ncbi:MAG: mandelate racemase/muconate lactonizing enzyme family protein [Desulfobaccales bacterium]
MIIKKLDIWHLNCKFRYPFKHKLAIHTGSDNLVVRLTTAEGISGYGEGIPRDYVTGESLGAGLDILKEKLGPALLGFQVDSPIFLLPSLSQLMETFAAEPSPAVFCALETALLDAAGRSWKQSLSSLLGPIVAAQIIYSAVLPLAGGPHLRQFFQLVRAQGMRFVKLKVGEDNDLETLSQARQELGPEVDLRVDANGAWSASEAIARLREMAVFRLSAVEQPVPKDDFEGLRQVQEAVDIPIMADESLCTLADAENLIRLRACRMFNIRLSKVGGLTAARGIKERADAAGIRCQLGCHVGETSILAAAGRHFAFTHGPLAYVEGSFAPYLLTRDPVQKPVAFGNGGVGLPLPGAGLGIKVLDEVLDEMAVSRFTLS